MESCVTSKLKLLLEFLILMRQWWFGDLGISFFLTNLQILLDRLKALGTNKFVLFILLGLYLSEILIQPSQEGLCSCLALICLHLFR